jgi:hypothetical protein
MTAPGCEQIRDDLDAWAIGALDAADARTVERHIASCPDCAPYVDAAREGAAAVALTVPLRAASTSLKARVMAGAAVLDEPRREAGIQRLWPLAAAAGFTLFAAAAAWGIATQQELGDTRDDRSALVSAATEQSGDLATANALIVDFEANRKADDAMASIIASGDAAGLAMVATTAAPAASGAYVWSRSAGRGALVASGLPPLPEGKSYCLWLVYERDWVVGGQFEAASDGSGRLIVEDLDVNPEMAGALEGFAVTIEDAGPVTKHEGETVLEASIAR